MLFVPTSQPRRVSRPLLLAGLLASIWGTLGASAPVWAAEDKPATATTTAAPKQKPQVQAQAQAQAKPKAAAEDGAKPAAAAEGAKVGKTAAAAPVDPLDTLRDRLAEKLGSANKGTAETTPNPGMVRIVSRPSEPELAPKPARAAPRSRSAPAAGEAKLTSVHGADGQAAHWAYQGEGGPESWGKLKSEFSTCANGKRQSPIDIRDGIKVQLDPVIFDYKPTPFRVIDNGHTVQVNVGEGNSIEVMGRRFDLVQFHFHRPSEERINGKQFDMVAHLHHKDMENRVAVIAVLLTRGGAHPIVQAIWNNLPLEKGDELAAKTPIDLNELLPLDRSYFTYMGSLTTPPCSEGVLWMVMKTPVPLSGDQINIFSRLYPMNARPIQAGSGRMIKESN